MKCFCVFENWVRPFHSFQFGYKKKELRRAQVEGPLPSSLILERQFTIFWRLLLSSEFVLINIGDVSVRGTGEIVYKLTIWIFWMKLEAERLYVRREYNY